MRTADCVRCICVRRWSISTEGMMIDFSCRYKFLWKFPLEDVALSEGNCVFVCFLQQLRRAFDIRQS